MFIRSLASCYVDADIFKSVASIVSVDTAKLFKMYLSIKVPIIFYVII